MLRPLSPLRRDLKSVSADGAAFSVMVGVGESYLGAFALALGFSDVTAGLLGTIPLVLGATLQLISPWAVRRMRTNKGWVVLCAGLQAASFVPLVIAALMGSVPPWVLFAVATIYWGAGMAAGPAWNTWMESLIPRRIRAVYLSSRARVVQFGVIVGLATGGLLLQWGTNLNRPMLMFAVLFGIAGLCRLLSTQFLTQQREPARATENHRIVPVTEIFSRFRHGNDAKLLGYLVVAQVAVMISAPFFTPFMLSQVKFSYVQFLALLGASFLGKMLVYPAVGRLAKRIGPLRLLWIGAVAVAPLSALWLVSDSFWYLLPLQVASGVAWAMYELASVLLFFETIHPEERTSLLTLFNFANCLAMVGGSLVGGWLLKWLGQGPEAYLVIFALSTVARFLTLAIIPRAKVPHTIPKTVVMRPLSVRPSAGSIDRPVVATLESGNSAPRSR